MQTKTALDTYLNEIGQFPQLTREEECELALQSQLGDMEARERLINCNLKLVVAISKRYVVTGVQWMDLIEEGNLGLMKAVERFDPSRECRLATYAGWWIRQAVLRALANQARTIRLPVYKYNLVCRYKRCQEALRQELEREPRPNEIGRCMKISLEEAKELETLLPETIPLDLQIGEEESDSQLLDTIKDENVDIPSEVMKEIFLSERVMGLLETLRDREREVLEYRFGVNKNREYTLAETGKFFGISRERVRQIQCKALEKLRKAFSMVEGSAHADRKNKSRSRRKIEIDYS